MDGTCGAEWVGDVLGKHPKDVWEHPRVVRSTPRVARHRCRHQQLATAWVLSSKWLFLLLCPPSPKKKLPHHKPFPCSAQVTSHSVQGELGKEHSQSRASALPHHPKPSSPRSLLAFFFPPSITFVNSAALKIPLDACSRKKSNAERLPRISHIATIEAASVVATGSTPRACNSLSVLESFSPFSSSRLSGRC